MINTASPCIAWALTLVFAMAVGVQAIFMPRETRRVPVERLAANLERQLAAKPNDIELRLNLARLHAMAYALKVADFGAGPIETGDQPFFPVDDPYIPKRVQPAKTQEQRERAQADLKKALAAYEQVLGLAPEHFIARLGYGWVLEQSGERTRAIAEYRRVVDLALPVEQKKSFWFGQDPAATEAATRLGVLLDPVADAAELRALKERMRALERISRMITPIAIPLGADSTALPLDPTVSVRFDAYGSGIPRRWTWIQKDAGWLVYDADGQGEITSALQWFGSVAFWLFWENGYHALRALDDNGDGELRGEELRHLAIWRDTNQNAVSEPGEVRPLAAHGIAALSCAYERGDGIDVAAFAPTGVTLGDGTTRPSYDVILRTTGRARTTAN